MRKRTRALTSLKGVGDKVADCVLLFGCGTPRPSRWMCGSHGFCTIGLASTVPGRHLGQWARERFGAHAGILQQYLFQRRSHRCGYTVRGGKTMLGVWVNCAGVVLGGLLVRFCAAESPKSIRRR